MTKILDWKKYEFKNNPFENIQIEKITNKIKILPNIVEVKDIIRLKKELEKNSLILQMGECAETFKFSDYKYIKKKYEFLIQCGLVAKNITQMNVIKIGRIAGQFAKPRSEEIEIFNEKKYLSYKGDMVNEITLNKRHYNPYRMIKAYFKGKKIYQYLKNIEKNMVIDENFLKQINKSKNTLFKKKFFNNEIKNANRRDILDFFVSKEALILDFEESVTKKIGEKYYNISSHLLWLGNKNCFIESSHVEYLSWVENPVGIKVSEKKNIDEIIKIIKKINPENIMGKILLIIRINNQKIEKYLDNLIQEIKNNKINVIFSVDPMHGNTETVDNIKTRKIENIKNTINIFMKILKKYEISSKGIHLETSASFVSECGIAKNMNKKYLAKRYISYCDPRLNPDQTIEILNECL